MANQPTRGRQPPPAVRPQAAGSDAPLITDALGRMHAELQRALARPREQRRWVMVIDLRKCVGCHACTIACVAENKLPPGVVYRPVLEEEIGTYPNVTRRFIPRPCRQCDNPPCTPVCPVNATYTNADGVVVMNYDQCIGCRACITACPYAARTADFGLTYTQGTANIAGLIVGQEAADDYERAANFEYGKARARKDSHSSPIGNARKCHFCLRHAVQGRNGHRAARLLPAVGGPPMLKKVAYAFGVLALLASAWGFYDRLFLGHRDANYGSWVVWGLWVAMYLFFAGTAAGGFMIATLDLLFHIPVFRGIGKVALRGALISLVAALTTLVVDPQAS